MVVTQVANDFHGHWQYAWHTSIRIEVMAMARLKDLLSGIRNVRQKRTDEDWREPQMDETIIDAAVRDRNGDSVAQPVDTDLERFSMRQTGLRVGGAALLLVLIGITVGLVWVLADPQLGHSPNQFVILVAPFASDDNNQTGRSVANELTTALQEHIARDDDVVITTVSTVPADAKTAVDLVAQRNADVLVWGHVKAGGMLDDQTLLPRLTYQPTGPTNAQGWAGYMGRFTMPHSYNLATAPINGRVILPDVLDALAEYQQGNADSAYATLGQLLDDYPEELNPTLPHMLRGNVLWARGAYERAAGEYRRALSQASGVAPSEQALLANNLAAILLDAEDPVAAAALSEATGLLAPNRDLGELRFNWGIHAQQQGDTIAAVESFSQAQNLLPENTPLLLALTHAYRESGNLDVAEETLRAAESQISQDVDRVPEDQRNLLADHLRAAVREQQGLLQLAQLVDGHGPLTWELEMAAPIAPTDLRPAHTMLEDAIDTSYNLMTEWRRRAPPRDVIQSGTGLIAQGQAQRAEDAYDRQRYHLSLILIEEGRNQAVQRRGLFPALRDGLFGDSRPHSEADELLSALLGEDPFDLRVRIAAARALRVGPPEVHAEAAQRYDALIALPEPPPEAYYGKGMLALERGDTAQAQQFMEQAIARNTNFFPARIALVDIAEQEDDWATAIEQLGLIVEQRADPELTIRYASMLRQRGAQNLATAEEVLLPLTRKNEENNVAALIELGRVYRDAREIDAAIETFNTALTIDNRAAEAAFELGQTLVNQQENPEEAAQQFRTAIRYSDDNALAHLALADLYADSFNDPANADRHYQLAVEAGIQEVDTLITIGNTLLEHDRGDTALETFQLALDQQPDNPSVNHGVGQAHLLLNNLSNADAAEQRALQLLNQQVSDDPELRTHILVGLGDVARRRTQFDTAIAFYNQALSINPTYVAAKIGLGQVFAAQGNWAVALGHFREATEFPAAPADPMSFFWFGEALLRQPDLEPAVVAYNQALALRQDFPEALLGLAQAQYALGETSIASETIESALTLRPAYAEALLFQGKMLQHAGRTNAALDAYSDSIDANDDLAETYYRRGLIYLQREDFRDAIEDLERAVRLEANFPDAFYWLGRAYYAQDQMRQALFAFERAVELQNNSFVQARLYQGMAEKALAEEEAAKRDEAIASFQAVIQADSNGEWGTIARAELDNMGQ